jgi:uncharacterized membrane protein
MTLGKFTAITLLALGATSAFGEAEFLDVLTSKYKIVEHSKLADKSCGICHMSESDFSFNPFGKQLKEKLAQTNSNAVTPAILDAVAKDDADGDGIPNGDELTAGTLPGTPDNPAKAGSGGVATETQPEKKPTQFPPKNGFHPAIVHFPIALLIAGLLLDLVGLIRKDKNLLLAGWYNLVLGAVTSLGAVASGFLAMTLMKLPYKGLIFTHLLFALSVTVTMWLMVALRVHRHEKMNIPVRVIYYALALAGFLMISWAGHLGGAFVYGE